MKTSHNLNMASAQWATRPMDERYVSIEELKTAVLDRKNQSWTTTPKANQLRMAVDGNEVLVDVFDPTKGENRKLKPTHWGFGQLSQYAKAPASYLRSLPAELAAINLQWGLENNSLREDTLMLAQSNGDNHLRSMTSLTYGRIWDINVVNAVERVNSNGIWKVPAASYATTDPRRATTLYASDRDIFMFLVDPDHPIEVEGETLFRGFITWNSEVGSQVFGLMTFLYRYVCDNRIIWGATNVHELRIRHTGGAPERFAYEGQKYLTQYANEDTKKIVDGIHAAKNTEIPLSEDQSVQEWLQKRGFSKGEAQASVQTADSEGGSRTIWDIVNGITAYARSITHTDERVEVERKAGDLMKFATE